MRLVVPDTSVMFAAFFPEKIILNNSIFDLSARARPIADAIATRQVRGVAPDALFTEFLTTAARFAFDRGASVQDADDVRNVIIEFLSLRITPVAVKKIDALAVDLVFSERVSPPDSWFLAAAIHADAELWYSHRHRDGIVEVAERIHPNRVFTLTEHKFG
jgi:hypothetical protein